MSHTPTYGYHAVKTRKATQNTEKPVCYSVRMTTKAATKLVEADRAATAGSPALPGGYQTKSQIARQIQKTERTVERWMREGIIPYLKIGKGKRATVLFNWPDVQEHFAKRFSVCGAGRTK